MSLLAQWYRPRLGLMGALLLPLSWLYRGVLSLKNNQPPTQKVFPIPVISIGNLTLGGTGKTPLTLHLARGFAKRGIKVGIVSRGYPASPKLPRVVREHDHARDVGDEPLLYAKNNIAIVVCADRNLAVERLLQTHADIALVFADDAMQHRALARDIDICVIDAQRGFGNGQLLPAGPLRAPMASLQQCDAVVINGQIAPTSALVPQLSAFKGLKLFEMRMRVVGVYPLRTAGLPNNELQENAGEFAALSGKRIALVAGLGNPERFFAAVKAACHDINIVSETVFADHHDYVLQDLLAIEKQAIDAIVMSEKDAVKCTAFAPQVSIPIFATRTETTINPDMIDWLVDKIREKKDGFEIA